MTTHTFTLHLIKNTQRVKNCSHPESHHGNPLRCFLDGGTRWIGSEIKGPVHGFLSRILQEIKTEFTFLNCSFDSCEETLSDNGNDPFSSQRPKLVCAAFHWLHVSVGRRGFQQRVDAGVAAPLTASTEGSFWFKAKRKELRLLGS